MKKMLWVLVLGIVLSSAAPASAQLFAKKAKIVPSQRVPELILIVKTDPDERKRAHAAEELRDYDVTTFTEIVPVLVDILQHDKKVNVRLEALGSLAKIRPVSARAGQALEKAAADDEALRVRLQAKSVLPKYHLAGYFSKRVEPTTAKKSTIEPPLGNQPAIPMPPTIGPAFPRPLPMGVVEPAKAPAPPVQGPSLFP